MLNYMNWISVLVPLGMDFANSVTYSQLSSVDSLAVAICTSISGSQWMPLYKLYVAMVTNLNVTVNYHQLTIGYVLFAQKQKVLMDGMCDFI